MGFGMVRLEQYFLEWFGVKGVFNCAGMVPRIKDQKFVSFERCRINGAVIAPILNARTVGISQNVIICDCRVGNGVVGQVQNGLPEFQVEILERNRLRGPAAAKNFVVAGDEKRLANLGVKAWSKNEFHELMPDANFNAI
jgi:hypothetical protein